MYGLSDELTSAPRYIVPSDIWNEAAEYKKTNSLDFRSIEEIATAIAQKRGLSVAPFAAPPALSAKLRRGKTRAELLLILNPTSSMPLSEVMDRLDDLLAKLIPDDPK